jgi:ryanodine receptor 2
MNKYIPSPIDLSEVELPNDINSLVELIAKNVHDVWAKQRIEEGWTYGEIKDSIKKTTPCLVPYEELAEEEKEYDRKTAMETLKLVVKLGYKITK